MANIPAWHHRAVARPSARSSSPVGGLLDSVLSQQPGSAGLLDRVVEQTEQQHGGRAPARGPAIPAGAASAARKAAQGLRRLSRVHPGRMLLDHLVEKGLSHLLTALLEQRAGDPEPFAPVGRRTAGVGWTDITQSFPPSDYDYGAEWDGQLYGNTIPTGSVPDPAKITTWQAIEMTISHPFATFYGLQTEPFPVGFRYASSGWRWDSTIPGAQMGYGPEPSPLPVDDEVDRRAAIQSALRALPGPRDPTDPLNKPWPTSPEKGDVVPESEPVRAPDPWVVPKASVEVIRDLTRDPGALGPPRVINGDPTVYVPPGRSPAPVVRVMPKPMRQRRVVIREKNLPKGKKLRARAHQAAWALRVMAEHVMERCDDVKALWASLDKNTRKIIRQRWFERRWAQGDRRPPKVPPCNEMAKLLLE